MHLAYGSARVLIRDSILMLLSLGLLFLSCQVRCAILLILPRDSGLHLNYFLLLHLLLLLLLLGVLLLRLFLAHLLLRFPGVRFDFSFVVHAASRLVHSVSR